MYAVVGATGNTGRVVARTLLAADEDVLVIGRSRERLKPLVSEGAEAFAGSVEDAQSMSIAFSGALAAYCLLPVRYDAEDVPGFLRSVGVALSAGIHEAGVQHVVFLSSIGAQHETGTGLIVALREQEQRFAKLSGVSVLSLRAGWFMENFRGQIRSIRETGTIATPLRGDLPIPMISAHDIGRYAAGRLASRDFEGAATQELLGPRDVTLEEAVRVLGAAIGKADLRYVQRSFEEFEETAREAGMSASAVRVLSEMYRAFNDGRVASEEGRSAESTTETTIGDYAEEFAKIYDAVGK
ncbi:MAG: NmrA family NAD(P)-binding protein [Gemmatimonadetes bacterium]|uniref:NmrA family NAD(P)-binding protein n=1 Tax=Candidatus Kutchimonas denitrificans TaxID=3056748 RepID=A0AAE5CAN0_9BACT|nr:NmrA family NAD(P)-binding protein [Gemmatimonadota bacterium]NIR73500.1 NmrA family NAD(P)-binding protein [Candidatus Kutchimonas denitrificans]NIR99459.1 NmrA family NAD(P)-binding protein [Gemmatimonadota bacterium]NIT65079.1 NmrA family NAD(P)-binding protein [Gemmatimonadota bacterium]NIV23612.1 NmrA family NAD(P)-binding protein [Gemmatimonadota bacterium]